MSRRPMHWHYRNVAHNYPGYEAVASKEYRNYVQMDLFFPGGFFRRGHQIRVLSYDDGHIAMINR